MMLLINTCGADAIVALAEGEVIVAEAAFPGREASEKLIAVVRGLLTPHRRIEAVAVVHGPGSFTGVRVGLSAAKGLCEARAAGLIAMSRLHLVALEAQQSEALAVLDAGRGEFYCGFYRGGVVEREEILKLDALLLASGGRELVTCEPRVFESLSAHLAIALVEEPAATAMLRLAQHRRRHGEWSDIATVDANYLRRTDAELLVNP